MLKLLRWEWEVRLKELLIPWILLLILIYIVKQDILPDLLLGVIARFAPAIEKEDTLPQLTATISLLSFYMCVVELGLGRGRKSGLWEMLVKGDYFLFIVPEPAYKILMVDLLVWLPFLSIYLLSVDTMIAVDPHWWFFLPSIYAGVMFVIFSVVFQKTVAVGMWYGGAWYIIVGLFFVSLIRPVSPFFIVVPECPVRYLGAVPMTNLLIPLLIAVGTVLFFISAYLLENKIDIWE